METLVLFVACVSFALFFRIKLPNIYVRDWALPWFLCARPDVSKKVPVPLRYATDETGQGQTLACEPQVCAVDQDVSPLLVDAEVQCKPGAEYDASCPSVVVCSVEEDVRPSLPSRLVTWLLQSSRIGFGGYSLRRYALIIFVLLVADISVRVVVGFQELLALRAFLKSSLVTQVVGIALGWDTVPSRWGFWDTVMIMGAYTF